MFLTFLKDLDQLLICKCLTGHDERLAQYITWTIFVVLEESERTLTNVLRDPSKCLGGRQGRPRYGQHIRGTGRSIDLVEELPADDKTVSMIQIQLLRDESITYFHMFSENPPSCCVSDLIEIMSRIY